ncbi:MAG: malonyl-ACP O-methyltransferase BioC [Methylococcales bacterium]|nr:malonyl-ACP O-methyltransferase BioC [Methylococcales bacterium]
MLLDKRRVRQAFADASGHYDRVARLQREVGQQLLDSMPNVYGSVADLGCGTGFISEQLQDVAIDRLWAIDIAEAMLQTTRRRLTTGKAGYVCADIERLPLAENCLDFALSNLALQWCQRSDQVFADLYRVLKPGGRLVFSSFGPATLQELKSAWAAVDSAVHVNDFISLSELSRTLAQSGLTLDHQAQEGKQICYPDVWTLMAELKTLGAGNADQYRRKQLTGKQRFKAMLAAYPRCETGGIAATFEIFWLSASKLK